MNNCKYSRCATSYQATSNYVLSIAKKISNMESWRAVLQVVIVRAQASTLLLPPSPIFPLQNQKHEAAPLIVTSDGCQIETLNTIAWYKDYKTEEDRYIMMMNNYGYNYSYNSDFCRKANDWTTVRPGWITSRMVERLDNHSPRMVEWLSNHSPKMILRFTGTVSTVYPG